MIRAEGFKIAAALVVATLGVSPAVAAEPMFEHVMTFGSTGGGEGQFNYVEDFDFDGNGNILVTDAAHGWVQVFNKTTGAFVTRFGGKGYDDANLTKPEGISVAPDGRIFVADYDTGEVKIYDASYNWLQTFSEYGTAPGQNFKSEFTDIRDGRYYMPEVGSHRINVFDLNGEFLFLFGGSGTGPGQLNNPESAKFNSEGNLYVADLKNDRIQVFDADGKFLFMWGETGSAPGQLKAPAGIGFDKHDNVYVSEIGNDRIQVFTKNGEYITSFGNTGDGVMEFGNIHGLKVDTETGWVYVADTANNRVQVFKPTASAALTN